MKAAEVAAGVLARVAFEGDAGGLVALQEQFDIRHVGGALAVLVFHAVEDDGQGVGLLDLPPLRGARLFRRHAFRIPFGIRSGKCRGSQWTDSTDAPFMPVLSIRQPYAGLMPIASVPSVVS